MSAKLIKIGHVYKLNAPWHPRHGRRILVVHCRKGVSQEFFGRDIYHIVDSDDFSTEPDWDSEYISDHFSDVGVDLPTIYNSLVGRGIELRRTHINNYDGYMSHWCYANNDITILSMHNNFHTDMPDRWLTGTQLENGIKYYDKNYNFVELTPPN